MSCARLAQVREEKAQSIVNAGKNASGEQAEEGEEVEEPYTLAEEVKRQIRREERSKRKVEEFNRAKSNCTLSPALRVVGHAYPAFSPNFR